MAPPKRAMVRKGARFSASALWCNRSQGKVGKALRVEPLGPDGGYFFNLGKEPLAPSGTGPRN